MTFHLAGGRRLLLAGSGLGWVWILAGGVALVLLLILYREERRLVSARVGLGLLALRVLAGLVLVAALFEPIAARSWSEQVRGRVLVAVDDSESMTTVDSSRDPKELQNLAASPGERLERLMRRDLVRRLVEGPIAKLEADHDVRATLFARETLPEGPLSAVAASLRKPPRSGDASRLTTDWAPALALALRMPEDVPMVGVVLVSDGQRNGKEEESPILDRLRARGIPVYPVLVGSEVPPADSAVASIKAPESVHRGDVAHVSASLKLDGFEPGTPVRVSLEHPGGEPITRTVPAPGDGSRPLVHFRVPLEVVGTIPLTVTVEAAPEDARGDNNRKVALVRVADDQARVLVLDAEARWEFRYLRNALARDPRVALDVVLLHQPRPEGATEPTYPTTWPARGPLSEPDPLGRYDLIVLGDLDPAELGTAAWDRIENYVAERGGTVVISPGPRALLALSSTEKARALLPVIDPRPVVIDASGEDKAHPSLPPGVELVPRSSLLDDPEAWPMLQLGEGPETTRATWQGLPRLPWVVAGRAKPGATVLVEPGGRTGVETGAAMAAQAYGLGKVLWVGTDATWRWRFRVGDAIHHRFWGQVVRWAGSPPLAVGNRLVRHGPAKPRVAEGDPVPLLARIVEENARLPANPLIAARIFLRDRESEAVAVIPLRPVPGQPRAFEGEAPGLPEGSYVVRLDAPQLGSVSRTEGAGPIPDAPLEVTARETSERVELAAMRGPLERLAEATGGKVTLDRDASALPALLKGKTRTIEKSEEVPLWDNPAALLLFFGVLTVEWVIRKRVGLP